MSLTRLLITLWWSRSVLSATSPHVTASPVPGSTSSWPATGVDGEAALDARSRRPAASPGSIPAEVVDLIIELREKLTATGLDAGPETIRWHLELTTECGSLEPRWPVASRPLVVPEPKKRPKSSCIRFAAGVPNECWQSDFTHYRLTRPDGQPGRDTEILSWLDDHSRFVLHLSAHARISGPIVTASFRDAAAQHGYPASTLTDNGMVYTTRFAGGRGGRTSLEHELRRLDIVKKNSRPNHPTTYGKVERFQQTMKKWLRAQTPQPATIAELQALLEVFAEE